MHKQFANEFYSSPRWKKCRKAYLQSVGGLCERCLAEGKYTPAAHVHHKRPLTPENLDKAEVTTDWRNLQALCEECHLAVHQRHQQTRQRREPWKKQRQGTVRWRVDASGAVEVEAPPVEN